jgi:hypothetical protein
MKDHLNSERNLLVSWLWRMVARDIVAEVVAAKDQDW